MLIQAPGAYEQQLQLEQGQAKPDTHHVREQVNHQQVWSTTMRTTGATLGIHHDADIYTAFERGLLVIEVVW